MSQALAAWLTAPQHRRAWHILLAALLLVISYLALSTAPPPTLDSGWDKLNHLLAFGALGFCAFIGASAARSRWLWGPLGLLGYGVLIELLQSQLPPRSADWRDVLADALGIAAGLVLAALAQALARRR
ncbi:VanZ family protein [Paucibacter sp. XJ19-41]|uniref:VanZ family protein n=1 Tax=Paucibacter sp. XJ19-41 TaxID=2927824 RepID=UPI00234AE5BE|nr:VanZ family protein [Paucibacter sp. XJ19-41]MDC6166429.1 VanZ family protein [Paucibacter sp. XJ19-41]